MPRTFSIVVFKFEELNEEQQKQAIEMYRYRNTEWLFDSYDADDLQKSFSQQLQKFGYPGGIEAPFSLSNSQGDGVTFDYDNYFSQEELMKLADLLMKDEEEKLKKFKKFLDKLNMYATLKHTNRYYYHDHTFTLNIEYEYDFADGISEEDDEFVSKTIDELDRLITNNLREFSAKFEQQGYKEIEYRYSDEYVRGIIEESDKEFEINQAGKVIKIW